MALFNDYEKASRSLAQIPGAAEPENEPGRVRSILPAEPEREEEKGSREH